MFKLGYYSNNKLQKYHYSNLYNIEQPSNYERLVIGLENDHINTMMDLFSVLEEPFYILYVLHTPRAGSELGRYQSGPLTCEKTSALLNQFKDFLENDSRHDIWIYSPKTETTIIYDRHDLIYLYGFKEEHLHIIEEKGLKKERVKIPIPHVHNYNVEYDSNETELIKKYHWRRMPLQDEDYQ